MCSVSVIITCYNLERYVGQAIESVLAQEGVEPPEIIVVDDCSTDGSADVIARYQRVRHLTTPSNSGVLMATLHGIEAASHNIICFLDGDDLWSPGKLAAVTEVFERDPDVGFVTHDLIFVDQLGGLISDRSRVAEVMNEVPREWWSDAIRRGILDNDDYVWLGSAFAVHKERAGIEAFASFAHTLPDPRNVYQDWPLAAWCASQPRPFRFAYVPGKLFSYRLHQANHSGDARTPQKAARNFARTRNTLEAILALHRLRGTPDVDTRKLQDRARHAAWLSSLYAGRCVGFADFLEVIPELRARRVLLKDSVRALALSLLGPQTGTCWFMKLTELLAWLSQRRRRANP